MIVPSFRARPPKGYKSDNSINESNELIAGAFYRLWKHGYISSHQLTYLLDDEEEIAQVEHWYGIAENECKRRFNERDY